MRKYATIIACVGVISMFAGLAYAQGGYGFTAKGHGRGPDVVWSQADHDQRGRARIEHRAATRTHRNAPARVQAYKPAYKQVNYNQVLAKKRAMQALTLKHKLEVQRKANAWAKECRYRRW